MKTLIALILAIAALGVQAKEVHNFETAEECTKVFNHFYGAGSGSNGFERHDFYGKSYFVKDGWVGNFEYSCYSGPYRNGTFVMQTREEFNEAMDGKYVINEPESTASKVGKVALGVAAIVVVAYVGRAAFKALGTGTGCANTWNLASDGSRCGLRAASVRPGGK